MFKDDIKPIKDDVFFKENDFYLNLDNKIEKGSQNDTA